MSDNLFFVITSLGLCASVVLLFILFTRCAHKWEIKEEFDVYGSDTDKRPYYKKYVLRCTKCGKLRKWST